MCQGHTWLVPGVGLEPGPRCPSSISPRHTSHVAGAPRLPSAGLAPRSWGPFVHTAFQVKSRAGGQAPCLFSAWRIFSLAPILAPKRVRVRIDCPVTRRWLLFDRCWSKHLLSSEVGKKKKKCVALAPSCLHSQYLVSQRAGRVRSAVFPVRAGVGLTVSGLGLLSFFPLPSQSSCKRGVRCHRGSSRVAASCMGGPAPGPSVHRDQAQDQPGPAPGKAVLLPFLPLLPPPH